MKQHDSLCYSPVPLITLAQWKSFIQSYGLLSLAGLDLQELPFGFVGRATMESQRAFLELKEEISGHLKGI